LVTEKIAAEVAVSPLPTHRRRLDWLPLALILPAVISVFVIVIGPLLNTIYYGFVKVDLFKKATTFVGLDNYVKLLTEELFWKAVRVNLAYAAIVVVLATFLGLVFALLLAENFVGRGVGRALLVVPWAMPWVVIGLLWSWVSHSQFGALNGLLYSLGLIDEYIPFMASDGWALFFTAIASVWRQTSFGAILLLAALQTVPEELYDAAKVDGATAWARFRYITLAWLRPTLAVVALSNVVVGFLQFDVVFMMTQGGPGDATMLISILLYRYAFAFFDLGMGAAVSNVLGLVTLFFGLAFVRLIYRPEVARA
jgi:ABC-type sugar transport system permease subunit